MWGKYRKRERERDCLICPTLYIKPTNKLRLPSRSFSSEQFTGQYFTSVWRPLRCCWRQHFWVLFGYPGPQSLLLVPKAHSYNPLKFSISPALMKSPEQEEPKQETKQTGGDDKVQGIQLWLCANHGQPWLTLQSQPSAHTVLMWGSLASSIPGHGLKLFHGGRPATLPLIVPGKTRFETKRKSNI